MVVNRISLSGKITEESKIIFESKLKLIKPSLTKAVFIDININKSSIAQCELISKLILNFKEKNSKIPVYTFAEEQIFGPSIIPLLAGDHVFAEKNTMFGLYDFQKASINIHKYLEERKLEIKIHTTGEDKIRLNPLAPFKEKDLVWIKQVLLTFKEILLEKVYETRRLKNSKLTKEQVNHFLNSGMKSSQEAIENNIIDNIGTIESEFINHFIEYKMKLLKPKMSLSMLKSSSSIFTNPLEVFNESILNLNPSKFMEIINDFEIEMLSDLSSNSLKMNNFL